MRNSLFAFLSALCASAALAAPSLKSGSVSMTQDAATGKVTIAYEIETDPAIVTLDVTTNGVSIGGENLQHLAGNVGRVVATGVHEIVWIPTKDFANRAFAANGDLKAKISVWAKDAPPDWLVCDLRYLDGTLNHSTFYAKKDFIPLGITNRTYKTDMLVLRRVPAKNVTWRMGSPASTESSVRTAANEATHYVKLTQDYYMNIYTITQKQYTWIMGSNPSQNPKATTDLDIRPANRFAFNDLRGNANDGYDFPDDGHKVNPSSFCGKLRKLIPLDVDLPTDAQWEYACRAGTGTAFNNNTDNSYAELGYYYTAALDDPYPVGMKKPNAWGIYDMHGNSWEYTLDWFVATNFDGDGTTAAEDPGGPSSGSSGRTQRGGSSTSGFAAARSANRGGVSPGTTYGNRAVRIVAPAVIP